MHYQVGYFDIFRPILYHLPFVTIIGLALLIMLYKEKDNQKIHPKIALYIFIVTISIIFISFASDVGSGWTLDDNDHLRVKAYELRDIQLSEAKIDLVDSNNGEWQLGHKRMAYGAADLKIGFYFLKNGKSAMVFQHLTAPRKLLILSNNEYIILSHPGIETLYNELLSRGVQRSTQ